MKKRFALVTVKCGDCDENCGPGEMTCVACAIREHLVDQDDIELQVLDQDRQSA